MLRTRVLTGAVIFVGTLAVVFLTPAWLFRLLLALLLIAGCWEFRRIADLSAGAGGVLIALQSAILAGLLYAWPPQAQTALVVLAVACLAWLLAFTRLLFFRGAEPADTRFRSLGFLSAIGAITFCWLALAWLREQPDGHLVIFLLLLIIWAADVGAYFSGKYLGRSKLAPVISPNKTWAGVYGGMALAMLASLLFANYIAGLAVPVTTLIVTTAVTVLASVGGDLFISLHKRRLRLDDTGRLFPGHGGVLDRYDSLLAGAPFFALGLEVLGR
jgi:phosphatidate cytidylyltransferase